MGQASNPTAISARKLVDECEEVEVRGGSRVGMWAGVAGIVCKCVMASLGVV